MNQLKLLCSTVQIALLSSLTVFAQGGTMHFEKDGLAFDYPARWNLIDKSIERVKSFALSPERGAEQITVITQDAFDNSCDLQAVSKEISDALIERIARQIHAVTPLQTSTVKTQIGVAEVAGVQLHGLMNKHRVTGEVYSLRHSLLLVSLVYLRTDGDTQGTSAWEIIRKSLTMSPAATTIVSTAAPVTSATTTADALVNSPGPAKPSAPITGGAMNGKAVHLVAPAYPPIARQAHASGTVLVQVIIDESGDVIAAHAKEGHPLLQAAAVAAARASKFSTTKLCGEPVRVAGIIVYNFVAQ